MQTKSTLYKKKKEIYYTHRKETGKISSPLWQILVNGIYLCGFERFLFGCKRARARPHARSARRLYFCTCARFHQLGAVSILCDDDAAIRATVIENGGFVGGSGERKFNGVLCYVPVLRYKCSCSIAYIVSKVNVCRFLRV